MQKAPLQERITAQLYLWAARLDYRRALTHMDARRRKIGKLRREKPPWRTDESGKGGE